MKLNWKQDEDGDDITTYLGKELGDLAINVFCGLANYKENSPYDWDVLIDVPSKLRYFTMGGASPTREEAKEEAEKAFNRLLEFAGIKEEDLKEVGQ